LTAACDSARARVEALEEKIADFRRECTARAAQLEAAEAQHHALREQLQTLLARRAELQEQQSAARQDLSEFREERGALYARRGMLEEFERRQEGLGVGVREILALAQEAAGPPWTHVLGHVVELLEVDLENAALLEVALGGRAQLIVLD